MTINLNPAEISEVFGNQDPRQYDAEVTERWGDSSAYAESNRRTSAYTKSDWLEIQQEAEIVLQQFLAAFKSGLAPTSDEAMAAAEAHRLHIHNRFYPCTYEMHTNLAQMYTADERFTNYYDAQAAGLAKFVSDAIYANALANS